MAETLGSSIPLAQCLSITRLLVGLPSLLTRKVQDHAHLVQEPPMRYTIAAVTRGFGILNTMPRPAPSIVAFALCENDAMSRSFMKQML